MADIRINSLPTTASASSSDDFLALDGATNGTRKLNAYSPTFGGNLTVSGGTVDNSPASGGPLFRSIRPANTGSAAFASIPNGALSASNVEWYSGLIGSSGDYKIWAYNGSTNTFAFSSTPAGNVTLAGNLTVSGTGTSSFAGPVTSTVTSGSSPILTASNTSSGGYSIIRAQNDVGGASGNFDLGIGGSGVGGSYQNWGYLYTGGGLSGIRFATTATIQMTLNNSGNLLIGTTTDGGQKLQVAGTVAKTAAGPTTIAIASNEASNLRDEGRLFIVGNASAGSRYLGLEYYDVGNGAYRNVAAVPNGGNFLVGTTVDSSALLQVGTNTTTAAGGMKFGTDTSLYRSAAYTLKLDGGNNVTSFRVLGSGSCEAIVAVSGSSSTLFGSATAGASTVLCSGNATTALTLDSSQRANFAGGIKISGNHSDFNSSSTFILGRVAGEPILMFSISSAAANERFYDFTATSTQFAMRLVNDAYSAATNFITVDRTGTTVDSVAIGGPLKLNNAYVAGAPTATGYVTIQDSAGNTYKVLVGT